MAIKKGDKIAFATFKVGKYLIILNLQNHQRRYFLQGHPTHLRFL